MSKNRISAILMGFIICLVITILVLMIKLGLRPEDTTTEAIGTDEHVVIQEGSVSVEEAIEQETDVVEVPPVEVVKWAKAKKAVNVRSQDSAESEKLGTLSAGEELIFLEILDSGWTKVTYHDAEGYVKSEYLEVVE